MTGLIIGPAGKKIKLKKIRIIFLNVIKKKNTGSIIGPAIT